MNQQHDGHKTACGVTYPSNSFNMDLVVSAALMRKKVSTKILNDDINEAKLVLRNASNLS